MSAATRDEWNDHADGASRISSVCRERVQRADERGARDDRPNAVANVVFQPAGLVEDQGASAVDSQIQVVRHTFGLVQSKMFQFARLHPHLLRVGGHGFV